MGIHPGNKNQDKRAKRSACPFGQSDHDTCDFCERTVRGMTSITVAAE